MESALPSGRNDVASARSRRDGPPFIGRDSERRAIDDLVDRVCMGFSGALVFLGEPGVGKTRLLEHLARVPADVRILRVVGVESEFPLGFAALHRLLLPFLDNVHTLPEPQRNALLTTFGLINEPPAPRFLVALAALSLLADAAKEEPLICIVDDAQWLDRESLAIVAFMARRIHAEGIGLLLAARENQPNLGALDGLPTHHLVGLSREEASAFLRSAWPDEFSSRVAARVVTETGGNPLAMLELVGQLGADHIAGRLPLPLQLPTGRGLTSHFLDAVDRLPHQTRTFLLLAAAMSNDDAGALWRAAELLGLHCGCSEPAERANLISVGETVTFRHPLIRAAVYRAAGSAARQAAHGALAAVAESDDDLDLAAWHRASAITTPDESVAASLERSAARAESRGGHIAQARFLGRAADLSPGASARSSRLFAAAQAYLAAGDGVLAEALLDKAAPRLDSHNRRVDVLRLRAAIAVFFSRHLDAPLILLEAVRALDSENVALIRNLLFDALQAALVARSYTVGVTPADVATIAVSIPRTPDLPVTARDLLLDGFATRLAIGYNAAVPLLRNAVADLFIDDGADMHELPTTILGWFAADDVWDDQGRRAMFERAAAFERKHGALGALRITLAGLCISQALAGEMGEAERSYAEAAEISALIGVPPYATTGVLLEVRAWQGREDESRSTALVTADWGRERGAEILEVFAWFGMTILEMGLGNYREAAESSAEIFDRDPPGFGNRILPEIVEACVRIGDRERAESALARLAERAQASGTSWALGMLSRSRALLSLDSRAEGYFTDAIEHLQHTVVRIELARAHLLYGEWLRRQKRRRNAQAQLETALALFDAMGASGFADRTRRELHAAGYHLAETSPHDSHSLTAQENHVAQIAASGATNVEIAAQMFLTTSTVEYHLSKIYRKLEISSRRQLSAVLPKGSFSRRE